MFSTLIAVRPVLRVSVALIVLAMLASAVFAGLSYAARPTQVPPPPPLPLGNPTGLTAVPGSNSGDVLLNWKPAIGATLHVVYLIKAGDNDGRYWPALAGNADTATVTGLEPGQDYLFIIVAGREDSDTGSYQWSEWSNWAQGKAKSPELPTPPPAPTSTPGPTGTPEPTRTPGPTGTPEPTSTPDQGRRSYQYAEIEGAIVSLDTAANTFTMNVREYEHFGGTSPQSPVTVDYASVESVESWLQTGINVEAEGTYYPDTNVLVAYEVERDDDDDDDDDEEDDDDES